MTIEEIKLHRKKYYQDHKEERKKYLKEYYLTPKGKDVHKKSKKKYRQSLRGKEKQRGYQKKYSRTLNGKESYRKEHARRHRNLGFIPLNKIFDGSEAHHINKNQVVYIPKKLHRSIWHSLSLNINMDKINKLAFEYLKSEKKG